MWTLLGWFGGWGCGGFGFPEVGFGFDPFFGWVADFRVDLEDVGLGGLYGGCGEFGEMLSTLLAEGVHELSHVGYLLVDLRERLHGGDVEEDIAGFVAVHELKGGPVCGDACLLVSIEVELGELFSLCGVPRADDVLCDLKVAFADEVSGVVAEVGAEVEYAFFVGGEEFAVDVVGVVHGCGVGGVLAIGEDLLLPGREGGVGEEEERARGAGHRVHAEVVGLRLGGDRGADEVALGLLVHGAVLAGFEELAVDDEDFGWAAHRVHLCLQDEWCAE